MNVSIVLTLFVAALGYVEGLNVNEITKEERCTGPGSNPQRNHYFNGKCQCKRNVKGKFCSACKKNSFHLSDDQPDGCLKCQCSSLSKQCHSAELFMDKLSLKFGAETHGVSLLLGDASIINSTPQTAHGYVYTKDLLKSTRGSFYWKLPDAFIGDKLTSYGGFLAYQSSYTLHPKAKPNLTNNALVILKGNGITLMHFARPQIEDGTHPKWYLIPLWEQYWVRSYDETRSIISQLSNSVSDYRCNRKKKRAKRKHLIRVLTNVESVMVKGNMQSFVEEVRLHQAVLSVGSTNNSSGERIRHVEQCTCPPGYDGLSCQYCAGGYKRKYSGKNPSGFSCVPCECNGNAHACNQHTGSCLNCQNNSTGDFCERKILHCDPVATQYETPDRCVCKSRVTGEFCTECKRGFFNKSPDNHQICDRCWCSGVTANCISTTSGRISRSIKSAYINLQTSYSNGRKFIESVSAVNGEAVRICKESEKFDYWLLPKEVTGNLLKSYGGNLAFSISNVGSCPENSTTRRPFVRIEGYEELFSAGISAVKYVDWKYNTPVMMNARGKAPSYKVALVQSQFVDMYHSDVNRNTFLRLLSSVKNIKIFIPDCTSLKSVSIRDISVDVLSQSVQGGAQDTEHCFCPPGYTGLSCENCARGYTRHVDKSCKSKLWNQTP